MSINIDKGIPVPALQRNRKYPWGEMEVGDSILVSDRTSTQVAIAARDYGKRHDRKFTVRKVEGGVRVWRVE